MTVNEYIAAHRSTALVPVYPPVVCTDGFTISVQASEFHYCRPRNNTGPYDMVECGFPSAPPEFIADWAQSANDLTGSVYPFVPVMEVERLIALHGGIQQLTPV